MGSAWSCHILNGDVPTLECIGMVIIRIINALFMFSAAVALIYLLWGSIKFILSSGDPKAVMSAKNTMTFAVIGLVLILSAFAVINFFTTFLGLPEGVFLKFSFGQ